MRDDPKKPAAAAAGIVPDLVTKLDAMQKRSEDFTRAWDAWLQQNPPVAAKCGNHPGSVLQVDRAGSLARSWATGSNTVVYQPCAACERLKEQAEEMMRLTRLGVPGDMVHATFDNWLARTPADQQTLERCRAYASHPRGALLLIGQSWGVGKTHLAVAILRVALQGLKGARFISHVRLIKELRDTYGDPKAKDIIEICTRTPFLVLDDLGVSSGGRDEVPALHMLLDTRKTEERPFVITSNAPSIDALEPLLGGRMMDRLREYAVDCRVLAGASMRKRRHA